MAKIKQQKMRLGLDLRRPHEETVVAVCYDSTDTHTANYFKKVPTDGRFYINILQVVADSLGIKEVRAIDQDAVIVKFLEIIERFKQLKVEKNRVILYAFDYSPKPSERRDYFSGNYKIEIWAGTFEETVATAGDGAKRYSYERIESDVNYELGTSHNYNNPNRHGSIKYNNQVSLNDQNERFFIWLKNSMENLITRLSEIDNPERLLELVSACRLLPLGSVTTLTETKDDNP